MAQDDFSIVPDPEEPKTATAGPPAPPVDVPEVVEKVVVVERPPGLGKDDIFVTLDMTFAEVLKYDSSGEVVRFSSKPGEFLRLNDDQVDRLSGFTRGAYLDAARTHRKTLEEAAEPSFIKGQVIQGATATDRLEVRNKEPGMHYFWGTPDRHRQAVVYEGYQAVNDDELDTFTRGPSTVRTVGEKGNPELILYKIPQAEFDKRQREIGERSTRQHLGAQAAGLADMQRTGQGGYDPDADKADGKRPWRDRQPDD